MPPLSEDENYFRGQWERARAIFDEIQAAPRDERRNFLKQKCNGDAAMLAELESLLEACEAEEALSARFAENTGKADLSRNSPRRIGPYQLDRLLGRGGMGAVYLAHRVDGQFDQQLAIKLIEVPFITDLLRRQFRQERQILAGLTHPFIARLLDGGVTADGELYLAMEYVDGTSILRHCTENRLSLHERLLLFRNVCSAVQYAHQNLVVHRDLKPDNILIVKDGTPRLLDFGTAKLLSPIQEETSGELTLRGLRSFTPQYASPEQVLGRSISTASDIYSLGIIFFQLLAETPPYVLQELSMEEMLRVICESEPSRPSAVSVSSERPDADLDSIALKALRKDPTERYSTVENFSADVQAWLDGRAVTARRGSLRYRISKFARRNKGTFIATVLVSIASVAGVAGVISQARRANLQRMRAEANAQEMRDLSKSFLSEIDGAVRELPGSTPVRRLMVQRVLQRLDRMAKNAAGDRLTQVYLADAYIQLGRLQCDRYGPNIGDAPGALESLNKAITLSEGMRSEHPNDDDLLDLWAKAVISRSEVLYGIERTDEAVAALMPVVKVLDAAVSHPTASRNDVADAAKAHDTLADELGEPDTPSLGDYGGAVAEYQRSRELFVRLLAMNPGSIDMRKRLALNSQKTASVFLLIDPNKGIQGLQQALEQWRAIPPEHRATKEARRTILYVTIRLADGYRRARDYSSAISAYEQAATEVEHNAASDPQDTRAQEDIAGLRGAEADAYLDMLNPLLNPNNRRERQMYAQRAMSAQREATAAIAWLASKAPGNHEYSTYLAYEKVLLGALLQQSGKSAEGLSFMASGSSSLQEFASLPDASANTLYLSVSALLNVPELKNRSLDVGFGERLATLTHRKDPNCLLLLAQAYQSAGNTIEAKAIAREGLDLLPPQAPGVQRDRCRILLEHVLTS